MAQGLQVFDEFGRVTLDTNSKCSRILGVVQPGLGQSVYTDDRLTQGTPFAFFVMEGNGFLFGAYDVAPNASAPIINFSGNQMVVSRPAPPPYGNVGTCTVYFGVR